MGSKDGIIQSIEIGRSGVVALIRVPGLCSRTYSQEGQGRVGVVGKVAIEIVRDLRPLVTKRDTSIPPLDKAHLCAQQVISEVVIRFRLVALIHREV